MKPWSIEHVRVGGWAEVCVGEWDGNPARIVFGYVTRISDGRITLQVADEVCSPALTGIHDGDVIEVELEDLFGSDYSPLALQMEERQNVRRRASSKAAGFIVM
jgi:hypothetical protein